MTSYLHITHRVYSGLRRSKQMWVVMMRINHALFPSSFVSLFFKPQSSSMCVCNGSPSISRLLRKPATETPMRTNQYERRLSAKATRTCVWNGSCREGIIGIIEYATDVPDGKRAMNSSGSRLRSSFWRTVPPMVTPQTFAYILASE